jgi:hypothetical protein
MMDIRTGANISCDLMPPLRDARAQDATGGTGPMRRGCDLCSPSADMSPQPLADEVCGSGGCQLGKVGVSRFGGGSGPVT